MASFDPLNPERFKTLALPPYETPTYLYKIFEDPDFINLWLDNNTRFDVTWASNANNIQSLELLSELIEQNTFKTGSISLRHTYRRPGTIGGGNILVGDAEDIINEVRDAGDRVIGYGIAGDDLELHFRPSWPKTYHEFMTNELSITMKRSNKMARYIVDQAISLTAMQGLRDSIDQTLDEFAEYLPALRG